ncbi:hypothetical protein N2152v2_011016 [Parachlorella kessleri]
MGLTDKIKQVAAKVTPGHHTTGTHEHAVDTGLTSSPAAATAGYGTAGTTGTAGYETGATGYETGTTGAGYGSTTTAGYDTAGAGTGHLGTHATTHTHQSAALGAASATTTVPAGGAVLSQEYFTKTEDRPVVKERVERFKEHRPVEHEYVVETRATGREEGHVGTSEHLGTQERVVSDEATGRY